MDYRIDFYLDTRRILKNNKFPLKLRVYSNIEQKPKLYDIKKSYSKEEYEQINKARVNKKFIDEKIYLEEIKKKVEKLQCSLIGDDWDEFSTEESDSLLEDYTRKYDSYIKNELEFYYMIS